MALRRGSTQCAWARQSRDRVLSQTCSGPRPEATQNTLEHVAITGLPAARASPPDHARLLGPDRRLLAQRETVGVDHSDDIAVLTISAQ
jgi:hypothetical protein